MYYNMYYNMYFNIYFMMYYNVYVNMYFIIYFNIVGWNIAAIMHRLINDQAQGSTAMAEIKIGMELHEQLFVATTSVQINPNFDACWKYYFCAYQFYSCSLWFHFCSWFLLTFLESCAKAFQKLLPLVLKVGKKRKTATVRSPQTKTIFNHHYFYFYYIL